MADHSRSRGELDITPEPDIVHDIFGHLPFMTLLRYAERQEMFASPFSRAGGEPRQRIKRLAWFSVEFGLVRQDGEWKVFGAG